MQILNNFIIKNIIFIILIGCVSLRNKDKIAKKIFYVPENTVENIVFKKSHNKSFEMNKDIKISSKHLDLYTTRYNNLTLRPIPDIKAKIKTKLIKKNAICNAFVYNNNWVKVMVLYNKQIGWIYKKTLKPLKLNKHRYFTLPISKLPVVANFKKISFLYNTFNNKIKVDIPRGLFFFRLKQKGRKSLLWSYHLNTVFWLDTNYII